MSPRERSDVPRRRAPVTWGSVHREPNRPTFNLEMPVIAEKPIEDVVAAIQALDLEPIKFKLMDAEEGKGWSPETVERVEVEYKRFLILLVKHPEATIAPSKEVDAFWHGHILDTMKYAEDCERVFGHFLHHFPYFGMRGAEDAAAQAKAALQTQELLAKEFGAQGKGSAPAYCYAAKSAYCYAAKPVVAAAYCYAAKPLEAAYCYAAKPAYCYAAKPAAAAYCYAARPVPVAA
jgi:hypothetical protein